MGDPDGTILKGYDVRWPLIGIAKRVTCVVGRDRTILWSYRNEGAFHEKVTNQILDDLVAALQPRKARLEAIFNVRGGVYTRIVVEHRADGWVAPEPVQLA